MKTTQQTSLVLLTTAFLATSTAWANQSVSAADEQFDPSSFEHSEDDMRTTGYDGGFFIRDLHNRYSLTVNGKIQTRWSYDHRKNEDDMREFQVRRMELYFSGNFIDPSWIYVIGFEVDDANVNIDEVFITKTFMDDRTWVQAGRFSTPFLLEDMLSSAQQLQVERSLLNKHFTTAVSTGLQAGWQEETYRGIFSYNNGFFHEAPDESANIDDTPDPNAEAFTMRADYKPTGSWKQFRRFSAKRGTEFGVLLGAAGAYQNDYNIQREVWGWTTDAVMQGSGWNVYANVLGADDSFQDGGQVGAAIQGGFFVDPNGDFIEVFTRYEWGDPGTSFIDENGTLENDEHLSLVTAGTNVFFDWDHLKWTTDFGYSFNEVTPGWANSGANWSVDAPGEDGQWVIRTQLQFQF